MTLNNSDNEIVAEVPSAIIRNKKSFSIIWIVPLVAMLIGGWMVYKALSEKGPVITISFKSAQGLEAGKTQIKYKDVEIGKIETIQFSPDLKTVTLTAELPKQTAPYLTDKTRFWVVRARISSGEVSGLGTLLGGAYIEVDPSKDGRPQRDFVGLEDPPVITADARGRHYRLKAKALGSLKPGAPIYYRQIQAGKVVNYALAENGEDVDLRIFIDYPFQEQVYKNTRFWNAGGIDVALNAEGLKVKTQSLVSIVSGGIAFDNLLDIEEDDKAEVDHLFQLYDSYQDARQKEYSVKHYWTLNFKGSVRGLTPGAPVEFRGIKVGRVMDGKLRLGQKSSDIYISVLVETEPERFMDPSAMQTIEERQQFYNGLVARGLRAQLKTGSFLTGQCYVDMDFHPNADNQRIIWGGPHPNFPTIQTTSEEVLSVIKNIANKMEDFPIQQIGEDLQGIIKNLKKLTQQLSSSEMQSIVSNVNEIAGQIRKSELDNFMANLNQTILAFEKILSSDSVFNQEATRALREVADAASQIRTLADYLERHPDALIYGKGE